MGSDDLVERGSRYERTREEQQVRVHERGAEGPLLHERRAEDPLLHERGAKNHILHERGAADTRAR